MLTRRVDKYSITIAKKQHRIASFISAVLDW